MNDVNVHLFADLHSPFQFQRCGARSKYVCKVYCSVAKSSKGMYVRCTTGTQSCTLTIKLKSKLQPVLSCIYFILNTK